MKITHYMRNILSRRQKGFILPLTLFVCMILLSVATSISVLLAKEVYFSRLTRLSQVAYYAADDGLMCATMVDDKFVDPDTGLGIFPYDTVTSAQAVLDKINAERSEQGLTPIILNDIKCATSSIFDQTATQIASVPKSFTIGGSTQNGMSTTYNMVMDLGGGESRCASVTVNKTPSYRQIISRGYANCVNPLSFPIERAVISTSVNAYYDPVNMSGQTDIVLTSGTSWVVPLGVTSIKVWAVGAGGGGAGTPDNGNSTAGGSGGAGGVAYKTFTVAPGQVVNYTIGTAGAGGSGAANGADGGDTIVNIAGQPLLTGTGGRGGFHNLSAVAQGGTGMNGSGAATGGAGQGSSGNSGGAGGAGLAGAAGPSAGCDGANGAQSGDVSGMLSSVAAYGYPTVGPGSRGATNCSSPVIDTEHGTHATGFGSGGGGAGRSGGNGGNGLYGGGGGGAAGGTVLHTGGSGGQGAVVISTQ